MLWTGAFLRVATSMLRFPKKRNFSDIYSLEGYRYEKIALSMDRSYIHFYDGIKMLNLIDWLLAQKYAPI